MESRQDIFIIRFLELNNAALPYPYEDGGIFPLWHFRRGYDVLIYLNPGLYGLLWQEMD